MAPNFENLIENNKNLNNFHNRQESFILVILFSCISLGLIMILIIRKLTDHYFKPNKIDFLPLDKTKKEDQQEIIS